MFLWNPGDTEVTAWIIDSAKVTTTRVLKPSESLGLNTSTGPLLVACSEFCAATARLAANGTPVPPLKCPP